MLSSVLSTTEMSTARTSISITTILLGAFLTLRAESQDKAARAIQLPGMAVIAFLPDNKTLVSGNTNGTIVLWDTTTDEERVYLKGHTRAITSLAASKQWLVSADEGGVVRLWDLVKGETRHTFSIGKMPVKQVLISPDEKTIAYWGEDILKLYEPFSGKEKKTIQVNEPLNTACFSLNSSLITAASRKEVRQWDTASGELKQILKTDFVILALGYSPDGATLVAGGWSHFLNLWDVKSGQSLASINNRAHTQTLSYSKNGRMLASGGIDTKVRVWLADQRKIAILHGHKTTVDQVIFLGDGRLVTKSSEVVFIWDARVFTPFFIPKAQNDNTL